VESADRNVRACMFRIFFDYIACFDVYLVLFNISWYLRRVILIDTHTIQKLDSQQRFIDYAIGIFLQLTTRNAVKKAIKRGELMVNGVPATTGIWMSVGNRIDYVDVGNKRPKAYTLPINIIYEDDYLAVVEKPAGIVVSGNQFRTLENALVDQLTISTQADALKWAKPVHRLDAATSGLVIFSKTAGVHTQLAKLFEHRKIKKSYRAIVVGEITEDHVLNETIQDQEAVSELTFIRSVPSLRNGKVSLVELFPRTGRTHQLRIHCSSFGHPIVGDKLYGEEGNTLLHKGLFLVAIKLIFVHPILKTELEIGIDQPAKFEALLNREERRWKKYKAT